MKRLCIILSLVLALGSFSVEAKNNHRHNPGPAPHEQRGPGHGRHPGNPPGHGPGGAHNPGPGHHHHPAPPPMRPTPPPPAPHRHYVSSRPSFGLNVSLGGVNLWFSNGVYYQAMGPSQYMVVQPPVGMVVPGLYNPSPYWMGGCQYMVCNGVVYLPVTNGFRVVGYL